MSFCCCRKKQHNPNDKTVSIKVQKPELQDSDEKQNQSDPPPLPHVNIAFEKDASNAINVIHWLEGPPKSDVDIALENIGPEENKYLWEQLERSRESIADLKGKLVETGDAEERIADLANDLERKSQILEEVKWSAIHAQEETEQELKKAKKSVVLERFETMYDLSKEDWRRTSMAKEDVIAELHTERKNRERDRTRLSADVTDVKVE